MTAIFVVGLTFSQNAVGQALGTTCSNPSIKCDSTYPFAPYQLPFVIKEKLVFGKTYKSVLFYAVILKSVKTSEESDCTFVAEEERVAAQSEFADRRVFTSKHSCPEELVLYENVDPNFNFMAVYAGTTAATAKRLLSRVRATGRYPQAYIKQLRVVLEYST
ncbi:MAG TPA: hypothetical protein VF074_04665 [Pyrinomonadaceae bacterium]